MNVSVLVPFSIPVRAETLLAVIPYSMQKICCRHMCSFKLKMYQNRFCLGQSPGLHSGSLRCSPRPHKVLSTLATTVAEFDYSRQKRPATVAVFADSRRFPRQSPFLLTVADFRDSRRFPRQSPNSATIIAENSDCRRIRRLYSPVWTWLNAQERGTPPISLPFYAFGASTGGPCQRAGLRPPTKRPALRKSLSQFLALALCYVKVR